MLEADASSTPLAFWTPARRAWTIILAAFVLFCGIATTSAYGLVRAWHAPQQTRLPVTVAQHGMVLVSRVGLRNAVAVQDQGLGGDTGLNSGDTLIVNDVAMPGIATTMRLAEGEVGLWAETTVRVDRLGVAPQPTLLTLGEGQIMIDLHTGSGLDLDIGERVITLLAPGRYRIRHLVPDALTTGAAERPSAGETEIAVLQGEANIGEQEERIKPGERVALGKQPHPTINANEWPLLRDTSFGSFTANEYNNTMVANPDGRKADTWRVEVNQQTASGSKVMPGRFLLEQDRCAKANQRQGCRTVAHFVRDGTNDQSSITAIRQAVDADVVSYRQVRLSADVRINAQSLSKGGVLGTECPVLIRVFYINNERSNLQANYCFWAFDYPNQKGAESADPYIKTRQIPQQTWYPFVVDLKQQIPNLLAIQEVEVHANGHDYDANVTDVRLDGIDLIDQPLASNVANRRLAVDGTFR